MSRVAVMMSENHVKAPMSSHFGKAEWVMAADTESHTFVFLKNEAANGKSVVDLVAGQGCTDAVFIGIVLVPSCSSWDRLAEKACKCSSRCNIHLERAVDLSTGRLTADRNAN